MKEPIFQHRGAFSILGIHTRINPMNADYHQLWSVEFASRAGEIAAHSPDGVAYGVYYPCGSETDVDFVAGMAAIDSSSAPDGLVLREVPACEEAVFECTMDEIGQTWRAIYGEWLPSSPYGEAGEFACYEEFRPGSDHNNCPVLIHVPIQPKQS